MKNIAKFNVAISELIDIPNPNDAQHPFATLAKFVFADNKPNGNKQGIKLAEFENVSRSAIGMPIKMNFTGIGVANHGGSIPIGHIQSMETITEGNDSQLIAKAMLWKEEFPEEIDYLKAAYADGKAPGLSYEIAYTDMVLEDDTNWIEGATTQAATFVSNPAYGSRTRLLAIASLDEEERNTEILAIAEQIKTDKEPEKTIKKGGNLMEEELELAKAEVTRLTTEAATKDARITELEASLVTAETDKGTAVAELEALKTSAKVDARVLQYVEAGYVMETDTEKAEARKTVFSSYDDAQWNMYLADLKTSKPKEKGNAFAGLSRASLNDIPKIEVEESDNSNLKDAMRMLARPHSI